METLNYILERYKVTVQPVVSLGRSREWEMPRLFHDLGFTVGAEIGVAEGLFSETLCRKNPQMRLYAVDSWENYPGYLEYIGVSLEEKYQSARKRLRPYNVQFVRDYSMNAVKRFADESLDFVYIDANHSYDAVTEDIREWSKKVRKGGLVTGHDFKFVKHKSHDAFNVKRAVQDWIRVNKIEPLFLLDKSGGSTWLYVK